MTARGLPLISEEIPAVRFLVGCSSRHGIGPRGLEEDEEAGGEAPKRAKPQEGRAGSRPSNCAFRRRHGKRRR